ncbi:MAG: hypothetical protein HC898_06780 [Phycisphaerales bacterium]|nr:hypothetical protein [Phycisphaerales bacterium]
MGAINVGDGTTAGYLETFTSAYIGDQGQATLNVLSGGYAYLRTAYFAANPGSVANVTVNNASLYTFNANVGGDGVTDGGMANIYVQNGASWSMSGSTLNLHSGGNVYIQGGSLNTGYIGELGGGIHYISGTLQVNYQGLTIGQGQVLGAAVTIPTLSSIIVGQSNSQTSFTIADGGSVVNHGNLNAYAVNVQQGGALSGNGQLNHVSYFGFANGGGLRVENAGTLSPGNSAGIMTIAASWYGTRFIQTPTGNIEIEIGGNANGAPVAGTHYDQLIVHGNLFLDGTLNLLGLPGPYGELTDVYQIIRYTGTRTGEFGTINWFNGFAGTLLTM